MQISAEIRWFWRNTAPDGLPDWFCGAASHPCIAGGGETRSDDYLRDAPQAELGIKRRGGRGGVEIKGLVAVIPDSLEAGRFRGPIELWAKWTSGSLSLESDSTIAVKKRRWIRKFDTAGPALREVPLDAGEKPLDRRPWPARGCNVELTEVGLPDGGVWWTLGFEAFGTISTVGSDLRAAAALLNTRRPPELADGLQAGYPAWLKLHVLEA